jgi:putative Mg2+ transporter-C (MgtC) family protein
MLQHEPLIMMLRILGALVIGAIIGLERSYRGRPAGFRTHAIVCMSSALLMLVTVYQNEWMTELTPDAIRTDPTRMAQGIMTGIGFLGAGVIFKDGLSVRGLTTAASIWITASIGILVGIGFWFPALVGTVATLLVLSAFRLIETWMPSEHYAQLHVRFKRNEVMPESELRQVLTKHGLTVTNMHSRLVDQGLLYEYRMVIKCLDQGAPQALSRNLLEIPRVVEFRISPTGD